MLKDYGVLDGRSFKIYLIGERYIVYIMGVIKGDYSSLTEAKQSIIGDKDEKETNKETRETGTKEDQDNTSQQLGASKEASIPSIGRLVKVGGGKKKAVKNNKKIKISKI
jgi:hypothetical protein